MPAKSKTTALAILSIPGSLKLAAIFFYISSCVLQLITPTCLAASALLFKLFPAVLGCSALLLLVFFFNYLMLECHSCNWLLLELSFNILDFMLVLSLAIVSISQCAGAQTQLLQRLPGPLAIVGAVLLATSTIIWYMQQRDGDEAEMELRSRQLRAVNARKSIHV